MAVRDAETKRRLRDLYKGPGIATRAASGVRSRQLSAHARARGERALRAADHLADASARGAGHPRLLLQPGAAGDHRSQPRAPSVVGGASVYPAVQNLLLACRAEGLGCVLTTLLCMAEAEIRPMLELPEPWATCGVRADRLSGRRRDTGRCRGRPVAEMSYLDRWGAPLF